MERYVAHLNAYLNDYQDELKKKFITFSVKCQKGEISKSEYAEAKSKIHRFNTVISNIMLFFSDSCENLFGYFYELSFHLVPSCFSSKDAYLILRYAIEKTYRYSLVTYDELPEIDKMQRFKFKSMSESEVTEMVKNNRINDLLEGSAKNVTDKELAFVEEFREHFDEFKTSIVDFKVKIKTAFEALDKFDSLEEVENLKSALKDLNICDDCLNHLETYFQYRLDKKIKKAEEKSSDSAPITKFVYKSNDAMEDVLTEVDVKYLKKEIKKVFDVYHRTIIKMPSFEELIHTLKCIKKLDEMNNIGVSLFIKEVLNYYMKKNLPFVNTYDDMIYLASIMFYYNTDEKSIYDFISYSCRLLKCEYDNFFDEYCKKVDKIRYFDEDTANVLEEFVLEFISGDTATKNIVALSIMDELDKVNSDKSYEYELSVAKSNKKGWYNESRR